MFVGPDITGQMRKFSRSASYRQIQFTPNVTRDRSKRGKRRVRDRKAENKAAS